MPKAIQKLVKGRIVTIWKGKSYGLGKLIKKPNTYAAQYSKELFGTLVAKGYDVQSPIDVYPFPGHYDKPRDCQRQMLDFSLRHPRCYNLSEPRTGKSGPVAWEIDIDIKYNNKNKFLIIAPLTTLLDTWRTELFGICTSVPAFYSTQGGTASLKQALKKAKHHKGPRIFVINTDKVWRVLSELIQWGPDKVFVDEASDFNNADARRSAALVELLKKPDRDLRLLTGTPFANRPTDAWSLLRLVNPATPKFFGRFQALTMTQEVRKGGPQKYAKWIPRPEAKKILAEFMQPSIRFRTEDVDEMPEHEGYSVECDMGKKQTQMYKEMRTDMITEDRGRTITASMAAAKMIKLLQISSGVCYDTMGNPLLVGADPKVQTLKRLIRETPRQSIVFSNFIPVIKYLVQELRSEWKVSTITGSVPSKERKKRIDQFQAGDLDVMIMHPRPTKYGLKLHAASQAVWFGPGYSALEFKQANSRIRGPGSGKTSHVMLANTTLERGWYDIIEARVADEEETLNLSKDVAQMYQTIIRGPDDQL